MHTQIRGFRKTLISETSPALATIENQIDAEPIVPTTVDPERLVTSMLTCNKPAIGLRVTCFFNGLFLTGCVVFFTARGPLHGVFLARLQEDLTLFFAPAY